MSAMANSAKALAQVVLCTILILIGDVHGLHETGTAPLYHRCKPFYPIIAFGDSTTDTGNQVRSTSAFSPAAHPPYGITFFKKPTGRYSDGRLMVDFLTSALKEGFLPPHLARLAAHGGSQNFAVAGATALDVKTLHHLANVTSFTNESLGAQLSDFTYNTAGADLSNALIYFGEIGGNDFNYAIAAGRPRRVLKSLFAPVAEQIVSSLHALLKRGVKHIVVQGQFPMGCISIYLRAFNGAKTDKHGCIRSVMAISDRQNYLLKGVLSNLAKEYKHANIVFFDTTAAYLHILENAAKYNFTNVKDPCYENYGGLEMLRHPSSSSSRAYAPNVKNGACPNPHNYINWDGIHLTDAMYGTMMKLFLTDAKFSSPFPSFLADCIKI